MEGFYSSFFSFILLYVWFYVRSCHFPFSEFFLPPWKVFLLSCPLLYHVYPSAQVPWGLTFWIIRQVKSVRVFVYLFCFVIVVFLRHGFSIDLEQVSVSLNEKDSCELRLFSA